MVRSLNRRYTLRKLADRPPAAALQFPAPVISRVVCLADLGDSNLADLRRLASRVPRFRLIGISRNGRTDKPAAGFFATLPRKARPALVRKTIDAAFANIELAQRERAARTELKRTEREMEELNRIGVALSETRDVGALLEMILTKARQITGADAGSLYLVEETRPDALAASPGERHLRFKLTQNDSVQFPFAEFVLPLREDSLAGYSAMHGEVINLADAYRIPRNRPYHFNRRYDEETGYRTRSLLTLPMKNGRGEVIGVLQLINCKFDPNAGPDPGRSRGERGPAIFANAQFAWRFRLPRKPPSLTKIAVSTRTSRGFSKASCKLRSPPSSSAIPRPRAIRSAFRR